MGTTKEGDDDFCNVLWHFKSLHVSDAVPYNPRNADATSMSSSSPSLVEQLLPVELLVTNGWTNTVTAMRVDMGSRSTTLPSSNRVVGVTARTIVSQLGQVPMYLPRIDVDDVRGTLFVLHACGHSDTICAFSIATGELVREISPPVDMRRGALAVDAPRNLLYVLSSLQRSVAVYRASTGERIARVRLPLDAVRIAVCASTGQLCIRHACGTMHVYNDGVIWRSLQAASKGRFCTTPPSLTRRRLHHQICAEPDHSLSEPDVRIVTSRGTDHVSVAFDVTGDLIYASSGTVVHVIRTADGRHLRRLVTPGNIDALHATPTALLASHCDRSIVAALRLPTRRRWQPDADVHALFDDGSGFLRIVDAVLATSTVAPPMTTATAIAAPVQMQRLPLELLCLIFAQLAPVVLADQ